MSEEEEGGLARLALNARAGEALTEARRHLGHKQISFASLLSRELGVEISENRLGKYERGERTIPAAVLLAASTLAQLSVDDLLLTRRELLSYRAELSEIRREMAELRAGKDGLSAT